MFTNNKENKHFAYSFRVLLLAFNYLSISLSFYLRPSPEAFHVLLHWHICALKRFQTHCCHVALHWFSFYFCMYQSFFWVNWFEFFYLVGFPSKPQICHLLMRALKWCLLRYHFISLCLWPFHIHRTSSNWAHQVFDVCPNISVFLLRKTLSAMSVQSSSLSNLKSKVKNYLFLIVYNEYQLKTHFCTISRTISLIYAWTKWAGWFETTKKSVYKIYLSLSQLFWEWKFL